MNFKYCRNHYSQNLFAIICKDGVASLAGMGITPAELKQKLGHFEEFCPVSFVDKDELVDLSQSKTIEYAAEFKGELIDSSSAKHIAKNRIVNLNF